MGNITNLYNIYFNQTMTHNYMQKLLCINYNQPVQYSSIGFITYYISYEVSILQCMLHYNVYISKSKLS